MGHRSFTDADGVEWNVWDVMPQWTERRSGKERRRSDATSTRDPQALERRSTPERRGDTQDGARVRISEGLSRGWLAFESRGEKRRLAPIPAGWESLSDTEIEALCAKAVHAAPKRRLIE